MFLLHMMTCQSILLTLMMILAMKKLQALSNAEKNHDVKPHIKVLYYIDSILIQYQVIRQGTLLYQFYIDLLY